MGQENVPFLIPQYCYGYTPVFDAKLGAPTIPSRNFKFRHLISICVAKYVFKIWRTFFTLADTKLKYLFIILLKQAFHYIYFAFFRKKKYYPHSSICPNLLRR